MSQELPLQARARAAIIQPVAAPIPLTAWQSAWPSSARERIVRAQRDLPAMHSGNDLHCGLQVPQYKALRQDKQKAASRSSYVTNSRGLQ